jgi:serine/threonine-protein kinase
VSEQQQKLGKYTILGVAGRGGMGTVYLGHDPVIDRKVAIKVYTTSEAEFGAEMAEKLFLNEAQIAGALDHPNILRIYDTGKVKGRPYMVTEYVEGARTLAPHCKAKDLLSIEGIVRLMRECASALHYAHCREVVHRDIKPENIMLTLDDQAKIVDFGVSERKRTGAEDSGQTVGTPAYMSPEQAEGETVTTQSDLYSLGATMYQLLTGQAPFKAKGLGALAILITTKDARPIRELRSDVPAELEAIVKRAMAKRLDERFQSGEEMAEALASVYEQVSRRRTNLSPEEKLQTARELEFFEEFTDAELEKVLDAATWEHFSSGEALVRENSNEPSIYVLVSGEAGVEVEDSLICILSKGDCVGELAYLSNEAHTASVVARSDVAALKIESPITKWGSIPVQMRFTSAFQRTLVKRLAKTTRELGKYIKEAATQTA